MKTSILNLLATIAAANPVRTIGEAMTLAKENEQIAFFCLDNGKEYNQDGTERM